MAIPILIITVGVGIVIAAFVLEYRRVKRLSPTYKLPPSKQLPENVVAHRRGIPVPETEDGKRFALIAGGTCPHCRTRDAKFWAGPMGGMMQNIQCTRCGWWFNVSAAIGIAQDIGFKSDEDDKLGERKKGRH